MEGPLDEAGGATGTTVVRRPILALLANLLVPPTGHFYVGEARRGLLLWLLVQGVALVAFLPIVLLQGLPALLVMLAALLVLAMVLPIDAFLLARRVRSGYRLRPYNRWYVYAALVLLAVVVSSFTRTLHGTQVQAFRIPSEAMKRTLLVGDYLFIDKVRYRGTVPRRGDVIVFPFPQDPTKDFIKRVVGLPNEVIEIRDKQVFINGEPLDEPYVIHVDRTIKAAGVDPRDNFGPYTVGPDMLFVMGDNRENSNDSRYWGPLSVRAVKGKAVLIYYSWDAETSRVRWDRVGRSRL